MSPQELILNVQDGFPTKLQATHSIKPKCIMNPLPTIFYFQQFPWGNELTSTIPNIFAHQSILPNISCMDTTPCPLSLEQTHTWFISIRQQSLQVVACPFREPNANNFRGNLNLKNNLSYRFCCLYLQFRVEVDSCIDKNGWAPQNMGGGGF